MSASASNISELFPTPIPLSERHAASDGRRVKLDQAGFGALRTAEPRRPRKGDAAFFQALGSYSRTFARR